MFKNKLIDGVIKEPLGGAHQDPIAMASTLKKQLIKDIKALKDRNIDELVNERVDKFCSMGVVIEDEPEVLPALTLPANEEL